MSISTIQVYSIDVQYAYIFILDLKIRPFNVCLGTQKFACLKFFLRQGHAIKK